MSDTITDSDTERTEEMKAKIENGVTINTSSIGLFT